MVAAIAVPYIGFLVNGSMPFVKDPRGMSGVVFVLGAAAYLCAGRFDTASGIGLAELVLGPVALGLALLAILLAGTTVAYVFLGIAVIAIGLTWAVQMVHHSGILGSGPLPAH